MKTIIICEDCSSCCSKEEMSTKLQNNENTQIIKTHCMDICPKGKISTIILEHNKTNDFKIAALSIAELQELV